MLERLRQQLFVYGDALQPLPECAQLVLRTLMKWQRADVAAAVRAEKVAAREKKERDRPEYVDNWVQCDECRKWRRIDAEASTEVHLPRSIEQITGRVGRVPLKQLVRESTDVIEALCIEAALKLTQDNRAAAAELLGLSRQSLYTKLRRFDIGDSEDNLA